VIVAKGKVSHRPRIAPPTNPPKLLNFKSSPIPLILETTPDSLPNLRKLFQLSFHKPLQQTQITVVMARIAQNEGQVEMGKGVVLDAFERGLCY
jgi:hypothetical protein